MLKTTLAGELPKPNAGTQQDMGKQVPSQGHPGNKQSRQHVGYEL